mmetsp:Transcript_4354/g.16403  ORF Transcript_4354/g.16403 Transcript_4354/m.16403 type:complete len:507 (-) Transcript_4354:1216-2736(-)
MGLDPRSLHVRRRLGPLGEGPSLGRSISRRRRVLAHGGDGVGDHPQRGGRRKRGAGDAPGPPGHGEVKLPRGGRRAKPDLGGPRHGRQLEQDRRLALQPQRGRGRRGGGLGHTAGGGEVRVRPRQVCGFLARCRRPLVRTAGDRGCLHLRLGLHLGAVVLHALGLHPLLCGGPEAQGRVRARLRGAALGLHLPPLRRVAARGMCPREGAGRQPRLLGAVASGVAWPSLASLGHRGGAADAVLVLVVHGGLLGLVQGAVLDGRLLEDPRAPPHRPRHRLRPALDRCRHRARDRRRPEVVRQAHLRAHAVLGSRRGPPQVQPLVLHPHLLRRHGLGQASGPLGAPLEEGDAGQGHAWLGARGLLGALAALLGAGPAPAGSQALGPALHPLAAAGRGAAWLGRAARGRAHGDGFEGRSAQFPRGLLVRGLRHAVHLLPRVARVEGRARLLRFFDPERGLGGALGPETSGEAVLEVPRQALDRPIGGLSDAGRALLGARRREEWGHPGLA